MRLFVVLVIYFLHNLFCLRVFFHHSSEHERSSFGYVGDWVKVGANISCCKGTVDRFVVRGWHDDVGNGAPELGQQLFGCGCCLYAVEGFLEDGTSEHLGFLFVGVW